MKQKKTKKRAPKIKNRNNDLGLPENIRLVHSNEANPHDG